jgi:hypothetical protein
MYHCERCTQEDQKFGECRGAHVKLIGGFNTSLCNNCANEWAEYIRALAAYQELMDTKRERDLVVFRLQSGQYTASSPRNIDETLYEELEVHLYKAECELYELGKEWVALGKPLPGGEIKE